jgi:type III restriction enzyme
MDQQEILKNIKSRMSLRDPLRHSLDIVAQITNVLKLKEIETAEDLAAALEQVRAHYPTCLDFERQFVSVAFSIATGVGKTRLMAAIITYMYTMGMSRNFFILAPGKTVYNKLKEDFGNPAFSKYVFKGIDVFVHNPPVVITSDNYAQQAGLFASIEVRINIFNFQAFVRDTTPEKGEKGKGKPPRIKRLSEYLGQSYWSHLAAQKDLVLLMDEAHRYHADKTKSAIEELKPIIGFELTATPYDNKDQPFKNIVYEYSLAQALHEGKYIKEPAIATRANFDKKGKTDEEIERIKLEDGVSVHETTKAELQRYAQEYDRPVVKPFVLVACKDTTHAKSVYDYISSQDFYRGAYAGKTLQIDSTTKDDDKEQLFLSLESPDNAIEIVIHVAMLKEGWDVTNLYTIVPLRASNAITLIEQTIGRGLRLPYGARVGDKFVDSLTVIAHDNFDKVIKAAQDPNSVLNKMALVTLTDDDFGGQKVVLRTEDKLSARVTEQQERVAKMEEGAAKQNAENILTAERAILNVLPHVGKHIQLAGIEDLNTPEVKTKVIELVRKDLESQPKSLFSDVEHPRIVAEAQAIYTRLVGEYKENVIEIPRFTLQPQPPVAVFHDFDLNTAGFEYHELSEVIVRQNLVNQERDLINVVQGAFAPRHETNANKIIADLLLFPEVSYESNPKLFFKLAHQALSAIQPKLHANESLDVVVNHHRRAIARRIYEQLMQHFELQSGGFEVSSKVLPFTQIEPWNSTTLLGAPLMDFNMDGFKAADVKKFIFAGFKKAAHPRYTFHSKSELDFARLLERDTKIEKWLRPAPRQFEIYYDRQSKKYEPDFVVEADDQIYLVEVKMAKEMETADVKAKAAAATEYCRNATTFNEKHGKKPWSYVLVPHDEVSGNSTFVGVVERYLVNN